MPATADQRAEFGKHLRLLRTQRDQTIQAVIDALHSEGMNLSTAKYSAWERGQYAPGSRSIVDMLEHYFDVPGQLHERLGNSPPQPSEFELLELRVAAIERQLGIGVQRRHLRAADATELADPGPEDDGEEFVRPVGADEER